MKDERYWPVLGKWLKDTAEPPPDPQQTAHKVAERLSQTPQLRRRWWLPSTRRSLASNASDGRASDDFDTIAGRTRLMLSPVKAITAGAIILALSGAFLMAQPNEQPSVSVPGASADEPPRAESTQLDFTIDQAWTELSPQVGFGRDRRTYRDHHYGASVDANDPRLSGEWWTVENYDHYYDTKLDVGSGIVGIDNADGSWRGTLHYYQTSRGALQQMMDLTGEGAYKGLTARLFLVHEQGGDVEAEGIIFEGQLPPLPDMPVE